MMEGSVKALAEFSTRRPLLVVLLWIAAVVGFQVASVIAGPDFRDTLTLKASDSQAAYGLLAERFPELAGSSDTIAWRVGSGGVTDPAAKAFISGVLDQVASVPDVAGVTSPFTPAGAGQISADGTIAFAQVQWDQSAHNLPITSVEKVGNLVSAANGTNGLTVGLSGQAASRLTIPTLGRGEFIGLAIAALILFIAFGSLLATTVPLIGAIVAITGAIGALGLVSNFGPIPSSAPMLIVLLGLGIGIDYALFITNRHRRGLKAGRPIRESVIGATTTSGRAVLFAGATVFIALAGMYVPRISFLTGLATSAAITVVFSVAASITLVPALLQLYGMRVLSRRERRALALDGGSASGAAPTPGLVSGFIGRHPIATSLAAFGLIVAVAGPALGLRLGNADQGNDPSGTTTRTAYDIIAEGFGPGSNGPLLIAVDLTGATSATALTDLTARIAADPGVAAVIGPIPNAAGDAAVIQAIPTTNPQDAATVDLVGRIRNVYGAGARTEGLAVHVGGAVASNVDFTSSIAGSLPLFFAVVVGLSMFVLALAFRSLILPLVGAVLNLLSAAAAFGVIVAVFQWGWFHSIVGIGEGGPIEPFVPVILFALLFGLSMDYQVFLVSRIAELWHATGDNRLAVQRGLAEVSRVIVAAAAIMVAVFGSFVTSESRILKLLGLGLAAAVFLDAFVIRVTLMPAVMRLLGRANWWMPRWLDRILPHVDLDKGDDATPGAPGHAEAAADRGLEPARA
ncbi:MAG TPA: MMPL family transporter [Demequinaceae bacterium]